MRRRQFLQTLALPALTYAQNVHDRARPLHLKIAGLKTFTVNVGSVNWVFCKVLTDQGLTGLGEGSITSKEATLSQAILDNERLLIGRDPTDIEGIWQSLYRVPRWRGGPILNSAISAIEIALWDIAGKALGVPIYKMLGGAARERVRLYLDVGDSPEAFLKAREQGFTAAKAGFVSPISNRMEPFHSVRTAVRKMEAVRKAVGEDFDIALDPHGRLTTPMAVEFCTAIESLRPLFVEEATQLEDLGELAHLRSKTKVPLATGERHFTKYAFTEMCARHLIDYVQPDVCHAGGILELKKIGTIAEAYRIEMAPHNPQSLVSTLASLHVDATTPACTIQEFTIRNEQWITDLFQGAKVQPVAGFAPLPDKPGLGCELDEKVAAAHPYRPVKRPEYKFADGAVADQ
ncbi:MAG TPA: galactonate dehydratase [Bryobacteraceae bacterium]|nr:galactonate dehydratase [Bryobacteraceae bacterium]